MTLSYTGLTDDRREAWDAMVSECPACAEMGTDEPCGDHDLAGLTADELDAMIAAWCDDTACVV